MLFSPIFLGSAQANEVKIDFGFFDTYLAQGKKFEEAFKRGDQVSRINIDGKVIDLGQNWTVAGSWFDINEIRVTGGGSNFPYSEGKLALVRIENGKVVDTLSAGFSLNSKEQNSWKNSLNSACKGATNVLAQQVDSSLDKRQSCQRVLSTTASSDNNESRWGQAYSNVNGATPIAGQKIYSTQIMESRGAASIQMQRRTVVSSTDVATLDAWANSTRKSIKSAYRWE